MELQKSSIFESIFANFNHFWSTIFQTFVHGTLSYLRIENMLP